MEDSAIFAITRKLVNTYQVLWLDMIVSYLTYPWNHTCNIVFENWKWRTSFQTKNLHYGFQLFN